MFEGIRFSIQMADVSHRRLRETLRRLTEVDQDSHEDVGTMTPAAPSRMVFAAVTVEAGGGKSGAGGIGVVHRRPEGMAVWSGPLSAGIPRDTVKTGP